MTTIGGVSQIETGVNCLKNYHQPVLSLLPLLSLIMAYPGDGYHMSSYGVKTFTAEEEKEQWREHVERESRTTRARHMRRSGQSQTQEEGAQSCEPVSYFDNGKEHEQTTTYDKLFHVQEGYSSKLKRDDLKHTIGLDVHSEEVAKAVPVLSNSVYGHPVLNPLETPDRKFVRVATVKKEFYRSCGANVTFQ